MAAMPLRPPPEEKRNRLSAEDAVAHHYDVGNAFYALMLGQSMVYSCAYWPQPPSADVPADGLDEAQAAKLDLVCRKLQLRPGMRLLDVGCGWGALMCHAAREYGVTAVGVTLSREQADYASRQVADMGLDKQVTVRHGDFREVMDGPFDAIASVEMAQHVGIGALADYATTLHRLLKPEGRLLDHHMSAHGIGLREQYNPFITRYVFPDLDMASLHHSIAVFEQAGFEIYDVENLRAHFAPTMRAWQANLERHWDTACSLIGAGRARAWRAYLAGAALMLDAGLVGINHLLLIRPHIEGPGPLAPRRAADVAARPSYQRNAPAPH
jgi:cyclopropane-fatty-acyl-phospholipid synthase